MICKVSVPEERKAVSRKNYTKFVFFNGFSYSCLGETVLILLAVQMNAPDWIISTLGAMWYFGYVLLPLGRKVISIAGAAKSQHYFWVARNCAALLVAASVPVCLFVGKGLAMLMILTGAFFFYGFRAAGIVMSGPLIGDITTEENRAAYISSNASAGYTLSFVSLVIINILVLVTNNNLWTLTCVVAGGAFVGIHASTYLKKVDETRILRDSCRKPVLPQLKEMLRMPGIKRLLICTFYMNLGFIMLIPISLLTLKRGYHISDTGAVTYSLFQCIVSAVAPAFVGKVMTRIGPRKILIAGGMIILLIALFWILLPLSFPANVPRSLLFIPFLIAGACIVSMNNALTHYYLESVEKNLLVTYAILSSTIGGAVAGLTGMAITGGILGFLENHLKGEVSGLSYAVYFICAAVILFPGIFIYTSLKPLAMEQRNRKHVVHESK